MAWLRVFIDGPWDGLVEGPWPSPTNDRFPLEVVVPEKLRIPVRFADLRETVPIPDTSIRIACRYRRLGALEFAGDLSVAFYYDPSRSDLHSDEELRRLTCRAKAIVNGWQDRGSGGRGGVR